MSNESNKIKASYLLITKDRPDRLENILQNIRQFIRPEDELVIIDGGSADLSRDVIQRHRDIVTIWKNESDNSLEEALNKGVLYSSGEIIINLSDDDYFYPEGVRTAVETMEGNPEIDALVCGGDYARLNMVTGNVDVFGYQWIPPGKRLISNWEYIFDGCTAGFMLIRRRTFARIGLFDCVHKASDTEYMSRLILAKTDFRYLDIKFFRHMAHPNSYQNIHSARGLEDRVLIAMKHRSWSAIRRQSPESLSNVLGLTELNGGRDIVTFIQFADWLRTMSPSVLKMMGFCIRAVAFVIFAAKSKLLPPPASPPVPVEPTRDGGLR